MPLVIGTQPAAAADLQMTVRVTIQHITGHDFGEDPDFYGYIGINGEFFNNEDTPASDPFEDKYDIEPNWEFSKQVALSADTIPVYIEIRDEDGFLRFNDDETDINPGGARSLNLNVKLSPCAITGDISMTCGTSTVTSGTGDERADLTFKIEVTEPPSAPGLRVRCMHTPLWPQPGQTVTVTAESLDGTLAAKLADTIEIWTNSGSTPSKTVSGQNVTTFSFNAGSQPASLSYGCRVVDDGVPIFTGWRSVAVGQQAGAAVQVLYTGSTYSRVDYVIVGDVDNYPQGAMDPQLQIDAANIIFTSYYSFDPYLAHQDATNFWLAVGTGQTSSATSGCNHTSPSGLGWADSVAIIHVEQFRDCAPGGQNLFSSEFNSFNTIRHESGHRPFGLADEYCCDGGYYQQDTFPNLYEEPEDCADDVAALGRTAAACREFEEVVENAVDPDWSTSEPAVGDLMVDNTTAQAADLRRINWYFGTCAAASC